MKEEKKVMCNEKNQARGQVKDIKALDEFKSLLTIIIIIGRFLS